MTELFDRLSHLDSKRLALLVMDLQTKLEEAGKRRPEPIAIVGMACRYPGGANTPEAFWALLKEGIDAIGEIPRSRFDVDELYDPDPETPGKIASRWGGFVDDIDQMDPSVFGIAPREAAGMDPQQRLLLETAWEALERAGYAPDSLSGQQVGVFAGICNGDYGQMLLGRDWQLVDMYTATGNAHSVAAGRISYVLGLQGPSVAVDTACSSSLVAVHLAIQSLRAGECSMALAGGANTILSPDTTIALSRARMMAPDGRCKPFDASANGFVRSEGCGIIALKRLADAQRDGDPILAVIRGSAVNQDGRSNGLTAPNGPSQISVIRAALADAGLAARDVHYVEAHGTGTSLGDPIEAQALGAALGERGDAGPLLVGSVKSNLGHLEAAAGIAGLMKVVLSLQHGQIPPSLHLTTPSPHIPWDQLPISVPTVLSRWPEHDGSRVGGVSSFGFSGTNAHILLESAPAQTPRVSSVERPRHLIKLAAASDSALRQMAANLDAKLAAPDAPRLADAAHTLITGRSDLAYRMAFSATDIEAARTTLQAITAGEHPDSVRVGTAGQRVPRVAFLFTGQGAQYARMGRTLYETQPTFRSTIDRCAEVLKPFLQRPLLEMMFAEPGTPDAALLDETTYTQPALFAIEYALAALWQSWGVRPAAVAGHSLGELVAACVAGIISLEDGLRLAAARGRLMAQTGDGTMAAVFASEAEIARILGPGLDQIAIAAINGPASVVLSGQRERIAEAVESLSAAGIEARSLAISLAGHSALMDPILDAFEREALTVDYAAPQIDLISGMTGRPVHSAEIDARYWRRHLREPVRFGDAVTTLVDQGYSVLLEVGPHPTLIGMARQFLPDSVQMVPSIRRNHDDWETLLDSVGALYVAGVAIDWAALDRPYGLNVVDLPTYPFQRERFWHHALSSPSRSRARNGAMAHGLHPQRLLSPALEGEAFETCLAVDQPAFLSDHRIHGEVVLPSPAYLEMLSAAGRATSGQTPVVTAFEIHDALILPSDGARIVQTVLTPGDAGTTAQIFSRDLDDATWHLHVKARLMTEPVPAQDNTLVDINSIRGRCTETIDPGAFYTQLADLGLEFGPAFRGLSEIYRRDGEAIGLMELPEALRSEANEYDIHPALRDACFHLLGAALPGDRRDQTYLMIAIERFQTYGKPGPRFWNHTTLHPAESLSDEIFGGDIRLYSGDGVLVAEALGLQLKLATPATLARIVNRQQPDVYYEVSWQPAPEANDRSDRQITPAAIVHEIEPRLETLAREHNLALYAELLPALDDLSTRYAAQALAAIGVSLEPGAIHDVGTIASRAGIPDGHHRILTRLLSMLEADGALRRDGHRWQVERSLDETDLQALSACLLQRFPEAEAEISLTARCGPALAGVLTGEVDPLQLLFPNGSLAQLEPLYRSSPFARVFNRLVGSAVEACLPAFPNDRPLRVLEIGAGTGATTDHLLAELPANRYEYWFTDVSPLFLDRARQRLGDDSIRYQLLDIEQDPARQNIPTAAFDIVVAANVLHATADIMASLTNVRSLLAPGGTLILLEGTRPHHWVDITFGLTEGWWRFRDTQLRPEHPLLLPDDWRKTLNEAGFADVAVARHPNESVIDQIVVVATTGESNSTPAEWIVVPDTTGVGTMLAGHLRARGDQVTVVTSTEDVATATASSLLNQSPLRVVYLQGLDAPSGAATAEIQLSAGTTICSAALSLLRQLVATGSPANVWIVTRGAQAAGRAVDAPVQAALWGLGRVIALERPESWGGLIDLDPADAPHTAALRLLAELDAAGIEDQIALRGDDRLVARLTPAASPPAQPATLRRDAAYLITGGMGGLGLKIADWLAENGAGQIVLTGRTPLPPREMWDSLPPDSRRSTQVSAIRAIENRGTKVEVVTADVANREDMAALFSRFGYDLLPLRGIIHAAAHLGASTLQDLPDEELLAMLRPKLCGTLLLHELSRELDLDFLALFSSTTALWGSNQLGHYAAANAVMDAFAHWRQEAGLPALSINWGTWDEMRVASDQERQVVAGFGLSPLPVDQALNTLGTLLGSDATQMAVANVDWQRMKPAYEARRVRPFLACVGPQERRRSQPSLEVSQADNTPDLLRRLEAARADERRDIVAAFVQSEVARALGAAAGRTIDPTQGLFQLGLDSLMAVDLKGRLETGIGRNLHATVVFNHPTIDALSDFLTETIAETAFAEEQPDTLPATTETSSAELDDLSEEELESLLAARLARL